MAIAGALPRYELERIATPTLIITAEDDLFGTCARSRYTAQHIPRARLIAFANGGHVWVGHQGEVWSEIAGFLKNPSVEQAPPCAAADSADPRERLRKLPSPDPLLAPQTRIYTAHGV